MAEINPYLRYKKEQRYLVCWVTRTASEIVKSFPSESPGFPITEAVSMTTLKLLLELVSKHISPVPDTIFWFFDSIIEARKATYVIFLRAMASDPDPAVQKSNESHVHWIKGLEEAFDTLGGQEWRQNRKNTSSEAQQNYEDVIFENAFSTLSLCSEKQGGDNDGHSSDDEDTTSAAEAVKPPSKAQSKRKAAKNGKKNKRVRRAKAKAAPRAEASRPSMPKKSLESYRIMGDDFDMETDYLMAVTCLARQMVQLRHRLLHVWRQVAYKGLNTAVASSLGNNSIGLIKDTQSQVFIDFPGRESFATVTTQLTGGNPDKAHEIDFVWAVEPEWE